MVTERWSLGADGYYHWRTWWGVGKCGCTEFLQAPSKPLDEIDNDLICPDCMSLYFYQSVKVPEAARCLT